MDTLQIILVIVLILLSINLIVVGAYLFLILKEFRQTVKKANSVLDNVHTVTEVAAGPIGTIAGIISGVTQSVKAVREIGSIVDKRKG